MVNHIRMLISMRAQNKNLDSLDLDDIFKAGGSKDRSKEEVYNQINRYEKIKKHIQKQRESNDES